MSYILLVGEFLENRAFNGANKALPVLASALHNAGIWALQLDLEDPSIPREQIEEVLLREAARASAVIFAGALTPQWLQLDAHAHALRRVLPPSVPILVGGYAVKGVEDIAKISPHIDAFLDGEGEESIVEVARSILNGTFFDDRDRLPGVSYVDADGDFVHKIAPPVRSIDDIDQNFGFNYFPKVHNMEIFTKDGVQLKTAQLFTQRGCPWACGYCNKSMEGNSIRRLSEKSLRRQLRQLKARGFDAVYLDVDTFTVNEFFARREAEILHQEGFLWGSNTRVDSISIDQILFFYKKNCVYMFFGVEHTLPEAVFAIGKANGSLNARIKQARAYPGKVAQVFKDMKVAGLPSSYFMILGLPKAVSLDVTREADLIYVPTSLEDDLRAIDFALEECEPDFINFNILRFMPGSIAADTVGHSPFTCVRPSGDAPITAGYFLPRAAKFYGYGQPPYHPVLRLCEAVGNNQPATTAATPERVYETYRYLVSRINDLGLGSRTTIIVDGEILDRGLLRRIDGQYELAPFEAFGQLA